MKTCTKCGEAKPKAEFGRQKGRHDGLRSHCKLCIKGSSAVWYAANKDHVREISAAWYAANSAKKREKGREWLAANAEDYRSYRAGWRAANADKLRAGNKAWYANNTDRHRASGAAWQAANTQRVRVRHAAWYAANPGRVRANNESWNAANPDARRIRAQNRRAQKRAAGGGLSAGLAEKLHTQQEGRCACCGEPLTSYHLDHKMPLALGGAHEDWNIQLLLPRCNLRKGAKHPDVYMAQTARGETRCA